MAESSDITAPDAMDLEGGNQVSDPAVNQLEAEVVTLTEETSAGMDVAEEKLLENSAGTGKTNST